MSFADFLLVAGFIALSVLILAIVMVRTIRKRVDPKSILAEIRNEVDGLIAELNGTTDRNITIIEERLRQLEEIVEKVDKRIGILRRENEKLGMGKTYNDIVRTVHTDSKPQVDTNKPEENVRKRIVRLSREGFSPQMISNSTGLTVGEVELIISLRAENSDLE
jgi:uncharacterized protein YoxC